MNFPFIFTTFLLLGTIHTQRLERLEAIHSSSKLPRGLGGQRALYDGSNTIYIVGGFTGGASYQREVLRYNILTDTLDQLVGAVLPTYAYGFTLQQNRDGDVFILGAGIDNNFIFKFNPGTSTVESIGTLPYDVYRSGSVKYYDISNSVFIFGGYIASNTANILEYDMVKNTAEPKGRLPKSFTANDAIRIDNFAYITGLSYTVPSMESIIKVNLDTWETLQGPGNLPASQFYSGLVSDQKSLYICGGYFASEEFPTEGIIHIDPLTLNSTFIPVDNFIINEGLAWSPTGVYVERLNRLYFFGGLTFNNVGLDNIWWIDLPRA